ncbi:MAG: hypothetical protein HYX74_04100 [Acidobacteria bacterium]|nr:hypothetical protein [Acidobacteriota bacterium]
MSEMVEKRNMKGFCRPVLVGPLALIFVLGARDTFLFAQWATGGSDIFNTNSGSVGIGTTTPGAKVEFANGGPFAFRLRDSANGKIWDFLVGNPTSNILRITYGLGQTTALAINDSNGGRVGIGTTNPETLLHVMGNAKFESGVGDVLTVKSTTSAVNLLFHTSAGQSGEFTANATGLQFNAPLGGNDIVFRTQGTNPVVFKSGGNVGIGTTIPASRLHVVGGTKIEGGVNIEAGASDLLTVRSTSSAVNLLFQTSAGQSGEFTANASGLQFNAPLGGHSIFFRTQGANPVVFKTGGNVGIGTTTPSTRLHVVGGTKIEGGVNIEAGVSDLLTVKSTTSAANVIFQTSAGQSAEFTANASGLQFNAPLAGNDIVFRTQGMNPVVFKSGGSVGIGTTTPDSSARLHVAGAARIDGALGAASFVAKYQDLAEWVPASLSVGAAMVVVLDPERPNHVRPSSRAYDTAVAGVISPEPGILLGEGGAGKVKVATTGRVKLKADATGAPIRVGDLLVTSDKEGMAMRSEPVEVAGIQMHRPGTLVGKALEPLDEGEGEILVLLSLQ